MGVSGAIVHFSTGNPCRRCKPGEIGPGELKDLADSLNVSEKYMLKLAKEMADLINPFSL